MISLLGGHRFAGSIRLIVYLSASLMHYAREGTSIHLKQRNVYQVIVCALEDLVIMTDNISKQL